ncbi:MAG TPA: hypothetical protein VIK57_18870 [Streptosporangiaceae bacterium]
MPADTQFQLQAQYPANLDRCRRCGSPRILHGDDGRCGLSSPGSRLPALLVTLGGLLAVLGGAAWLLATSPAMNTASVLAFGGLVVLVLAGAAMALTRRS